MTSYSGSVAYLKYVALTDKGSVKKGDMFNSVFAHGAMTEGRMNYTSQVVVEAASGGTATPALTVKEGGISYVDGNTVKYADIKVIKTDGSIQYVAKGSIPASDVAKIAYVSEEFQMEKIPAKDIPTIGPKMERIALVAEPRRIAVRYDQITAFQA